MGKLAHAYANSEFFVRLPVVRISGAVGRILGFRDLFLSDETIRFNDQPLRHSVLLASNIIDTPTAPKVTVRAVQILSVEQGLCSPDVAFLQSFCHSS